MTRCARTQPRREFDLTIEPVPWGPIRFYRWTVDLDDRVLGYGTAFTYQRALRQTLATVRALRFASVVDPELTGVGAG